MHRPYLTAKEIIRMMVVENIVKASHSRAAYRDADNGENWAEWAKKNPGLNSILIDAELAANGRSES